MRLPTDVAMVLNTGPVRTVAVLTLALLVLGGCSGGESAGPDESVTSIAPVVAVDQGSSTTSSSTSSTSIPRDLDMFVAPTDALESFTFALSMVDVGEEPFGIVSGGGFVAPDAVACEAGNPALIGGSLGIGTAIGETFWFDDGFFEATPEDRTGDSGSEWLGFCPGASEYWASPLFLDDRVTWSFDGPGEIIEGMPTSMYSLAGSEDLEIDSGTVWLTEEGWPVRIEIDGSVVGGIFSFFGTEGDAEMADGHVAFEFVLALSDFSGAQIVRAPDGSAVVGPVGEVVSTVSTTIPPTGEVADAMAAAKDSLCFDNGTLSWLTLGTNIESLELSNVETAAVDGALTQITPGMVGGGFGTQVTTKTHGDLAYTQADLLFNHLAPLVALLDWTGTPPPTTSSDGSLYVSISDSADVDATHYVSWDGLVMTFDDGATEDFSYHGYLAYPEASLALTPDAEEDARSRIETWTTSMIDVANGLRQADIQAAANLEAIADDLDDTEALACALLGTAWVASDRADTSGKDPSQFFVDEIAVQHTMLAIEYAKLLAHHLDRPSIDWLRGEDLNLDTSFTAGDTTGTVLRFFSDLLAEALTFSSTEAYQ